MHTVYDKQEPFLARSLLHSHLEFLDPREFAYAFTARGARDFIVADLLTKHEFHPNCPYVRTKSGGLYQLEKFTRLKDVMAVLPEHFFPGNRGVIVNADARDFLRGTSTIGVSVRIDKQHATIEWIKLSRSGLRESDRRQKLPPARAKRARKT